MRQDANNEIKEIDILQVDKFISKRIVRKNLSRESTNKKKQVPAVLCSKHTINSNQISHLIKKNKT